VKRFYTLKLGFIMKTTFLAPIIFCTFAALAPHSAHAGATDSDGGTNSNTVSPNSETQNMATNGATDLPDDGEDNDYGWIGLLGLLGLAGLMKRDRADTNRTTSR
jgi:hypothetical protein